jgi:outer membrane protein assembly factor BamB
MKILERCLLIAPRVAVLALSLLALVCCGSLTTEDWPQWRGARRDGVYRETGIVDKLPEKLRYRWRKKIGAGYAGPAVAAGRVYVMDGVTESDGGRPTGERVLCLDAKNGDTIWTHGYSCERYTVQYASGPRVTPTVDGDRVYTLGTMGDLHCLRVSDGKVLWTKNFVREFDTKINVWGMSAAPVVDGDRLIALVGGKPGACVVAMDKITGKEIWRGLEIDDPGYAPLTIVDAGGERQVLVWTPKFIASLDSATGRQNWQQPCSVNAGLTIVAPIHLPGEGRLFVSSFYNGSIMLSLGKDSSAPQVLWRGKSDSEIKTDGLHALMCTPSFRDGLFYGVGSYGQLRCVDSNTGERVWESLEATGKGRWWNAFLVPHRNDKDDRYFICNEQGELIIAQLDRKGYHELSRAHLIEPTGAEQGRKLVWSHPAFANRAVYARNDKEIVCADLAAK